MRRMRRFRLIPLMRKVSSWHLLFVCFELLRPNNPIGSCRARWRFWVDCANAQTDLNLYGSKWTFSDVWAHLSLSSKKSMFWCSNVCIIRILNKYDFDHYKAKLPCDWVLIWDINNWISCNSAFTFPCICLQYIKASKGLEVILRNSIVHCS